jgi:hypothetical protein
MRLFRLGVALFSLSFALSSAERPALPSPEHVCEFKDGAIPEPSGLVLSPGWGSQGIYWTLPDSGSKAFIYSFDLKGRVQRKVDVMGAENIDWEEIAADDSGRLILADIGDNGRKRKTITLYRMPEPDPKAWGSGFGGACRLEWRGVSVHERCDATARVSAAAAGSSAGGGHGGRSGVC